MYKVFVYENLPSPGLPDEVLEFADMASVNRFLEEQARKFVYDAVKPYVYITEKV